MIKIHEVFYRVVSLNKYYEFTPNKNDLVLADRFVGWIERKSVSHGLSFLFDYFLFQFNYWYQKDTKFGRGKVMFSWVVGDKARKRWENRNYETYNWCVSNSIKKRLRISIGELFKPPLKDLYSPHEEIEKKRFHNTDLGPVWCGSNTTLYYSKSEMCKNCKSAPACAKLLKSKYPKLYKLRYDQEV